MVPFLTLQKVLAPANPKIGKISPTGIHVSAEILSRTDATGKEHFLFHSTDNILGIYLKVFVFNWYPI